jgi:hypothetical protein
LAPGTNVVRIHVSDVSGNVTEVAIHIYFFQKTALTVLINGAGIVKPNLDGIILESGKLFKMTEKPAKDYVFAGWSGNVTAGASTLNFIMQSNMVLQANFAVNPFPPAAGTYSGAVTPKVSGQQEGSLKVVVSRKGKFSAKFQFGDQVFRLSGTFLAGGSYSGTILRKKIPNNPPIMVQLQLDINNGKISGTVTDRLLSQVPTGDVLATFKPKSGR